jgi:uncharacterized protein
MAEMLNFPFELMQFPLYADIACCGSYSSEECDYHPEHRFPDHDFADRTMPITTLEVFIRHYTEAQIHSDLHYYWRGGDPLLVSVDYMEQAVGLAKKYALGVPVRHHLHTPGTRINERWCDFFSRHGVEVSVELDGPPSYHEAYRRSMEAHSSFGRCTRRTLESLELLRQYGITHHVVVNVHDRNSTNALETYEYLKDHGVQTMRFRPVVTPGGRNRVAEHSVTPLSYGNFLVTIFDRWIRHDVGDVRVLDFELTLHQQQLHEARIAEGHQPGACVFAATCGHHAYFSPGGVLYPCRHYTQPDDRLGTLRDDTFTGLLYGRKQLKFGAGKHTTLTHQCQVCPYLEYCHGGCMRHRHALSDSGQKGHPYLCAAYKIYFAHVLTPLRYLADELRTGRSANRMRHYYHQFSSPQAGVNRK